MTPIATPDAPFDLMIDSGGDQFIVSGPAPRLSWKPSTRADVPDAYELSAKVDGVALPTVLSGSADHLFIEWPWSPLASRSRVSWRVRALSGGRPSEWSDAASFEVGLLDPDWQAEWISPIETDDPGYGHRPAHALSADFPIAGTVVSARLYSTALGVYEAFVNTTRAGTAVLSPGTTSYDRTLYAQASDVGASLRLGQNRIEILISDGWYRGQVGAFRIPAGWGTTVGARVELHIEFDDGTRQVVRSDGTWSSAPSNIVRADLMDGQVTDFTVEPQDHSGVLVGKVTAPPISWSPAPPVRVIETRAPVSVVAVGDGTWVADFGQNASGWVVVTDLGPAGTRTVIEYGEHLGPDGDLSTSHLDSHRPGEPTRVFRQSDEVVASGGSERFEPRHTIHGFQYVRVRRDGAFDPASITMQVVHSDLRRTGTFTCSDPDLTRLHQMAEWSFRGNAVDVPTDCPTRERLAWTGDYQVFAPTATRLYDVLGFSRKWLQSVRDDQLDDGRIANFSPDGRRIKLNLSDQFAMMTGSSGWGDAITEVPWELYVSYGDRAVLSENWDAMVRWVDWALQTARTQRHPSRVERSAVPLAHEEYLWDGSFHWGEWTEPKQRGADGELIDPVQHNPMAWFMADKGEVGTAYLHRSSAILARTAEVLGRAEDAARYAAIAARVLEAWRTEFLSSDGRTVGDTQAGYVRALAFGLVPDQLRPAAAQRLVELIRSAGNHLGTGFLATGHLLPVLVEAGYADVAYQLLFQRSAPSWLYMVDRGATTIWEDWLGIDEEGHAHESLNHYSKGAVIRFLHTHTLGLRQEHDSVGWESIVVEPTPHPSITWARGSHDSPNGRIEVAWKVEGGDLHIEVEVPAGTIARIVHPGRGEEVVGAGLHRVRGPFAFALPEARNGNRLTGASLEGSNGAHAPTAAPRP